MRMLRLGLLAGILALCLAAPAWAHMMWLNLDKAEVKPGEAVAVEIGWGHKYPKDKTCPPDKLAWFKAQDPAGKAVKLDGPASGPAALPAQQKGCYLVSAAYTPGLLTKTADGYKNQGKKGLEDVLTCFRYDIRSKALIQVGGGTEGAERLLGDPLEITLPKGAAGLKPGDALPVKVLFMGKPLAGAKINYTYAGFKGKEGNWAASAKTDEQGRAVINIKGLGGQLLAVRHKTPYKDPAECDDNLYACTLTFNIK